MKNNNGTFQRDLSLLQPYLDAEKNTPGSLIKILQRAQSIYGYLPREVIKEISIALEIPVARIMGVITFYSQFRLEPIGKYLLMVCQGTACHVNGSQKVVQALENELGIESGSTTSDGLFTLEKVACLGCCSMAPVMMVQSRGKNKVFSELTPSSVVKIIKKYRESEEGAS